MKHESTETVVVGSTTEELTPAVTPETPAPTADEDVFTPVGEVPKTDEETLDETPAPDVVPETVPEAPAPTVSEVKPEAKSAKAAGKTKPAPVAPKAKKGESTEETVQVEFKISVTYKASKYSKGDIANLTETELKDLKDTWYKVL